jgi:MoaA/NifB/PqqE/SkfB family radical SAM enzyme
MKSTILRKYLIKKDEKSFQKEFLQKTKLSYPPRHVTIGIASPCNNKCVFCAYHALDARDTSNVYNLHYKISFNDFKRMVDICYAGRVPAIHISATGEPFFHDDIMSMIDYVIKIYGSVSFQTNFFRPLFEKNDYLENIIERSPYITKITTDMLSGNPLQHEQLKKGSTYEDVLSILEYLSKRSNVKFEIHYILTKTNYMSIDPLIRDLHSRQIRCYVAVVNLHPHNFNSFTSPDMMYRSSDTAITDELYRIENVGNKYGIEVKICKPSDSKDIKCGSFWSRFQTWPVKGIAEERYHENVIVGGCNAVVKGNLNTLGLFFDYKTIMDLWNNDYFLKIRSNLIKGIYPDTECKDCQAYNN